MNFHNQEHDKAISAIEKWFKNKRDWEKIKALGVYGINAPFDALMDILRNSESLPITYTKSEWKDLVEYVKNQQEPESVTVVKLAEGTKNDAKISQQSHSAWQLYRTKLEKKNWATESINYIESSAYEILQMLSQNTESNSPVKGLVLGNVQSGKTANMAGLMAMAADYGFNYFVVLSGMIENLREQTEKRLYDDLSSPGNLNWQIIKNPHPTKASSPAEKMENLQLSSSSKKRYFSIVLKNSVRMQNLVKWLYSNPDKARQLKILVIDDEADQASINTRKMDSTGVDTSEEEFERTAINKQIINLVEGYKGHKLKAVNYICYTATPYANLLNEANDYTLYPKDFVISLSPSDDYIGPKQLFGLNEPEESASLDIIREIPTHDVKLLSQIHKGKHYETPKSLIKAIQWFLMTTVAMRHNGHKKPLSMLIHTTQLIYEHTELEKVITNYLHYIKIIDSDEFITQCRDLYLKETHDFTKKDFLVGMSGYSTEPKDIPDYPEWDAIKKGLMALLARDDEEYLSHIKLDEEGAKIFHRGIHLCIDNSKATGADDEIVRLVYPDKSNDPGYATVFIVIGGNTLSRGLTLEGLTTSYFMRNTIASDTLMQMGRWFGFRQGYEVFPRVWMNEAVKERYAFVTQLDQELREEIEDFSRLGKTPKDFGIKVKNSPNNAFIKITSNNKMQGALDTNLNFAGIQKQTILFENTFKMLDSNVKMTEKFLNNLSTPKVKGSRLIWQNVEYETLRQSFFSKYQASDKDIMFSNLDALLKWCDSIDGENILDNWSVVLSSKGNINNIGDTRFSNDDIMWNVQGHGVKKVSRSVLGSRQADGKTVSIGALRSPADLLTDITQLSNEERKGTKKISEVREIRRKYGYENVPQLVIYRVDKNSEPDSSKRNTDTDSANRRSPLNFSQDLIGISIMIPGMKNSQNIAEKLVVRLPESD